MPKKQSLQNRSPIRTKKADRNLQSKILPTRIHEEKSVRKSLSKTPSFSPITLQQPCNNPCFLPTLVAALFLRLLQITLRFLGKLLQPSSLVVTRNVAGKAPFIGFPHASFSRLVAFYIPFRVATTPYVYASPTSLVA